MCASKVSRVSGEAGMVLTKLTVVRLCEDWCCNRLSTNRKDWNVRTILSA